MYATKRRRRTVKSTKAPPKDPPKSNPSKRHRERLNSELDRLASLLPFEQSVITKLDKLSILRLGVSYLRTKTYFQDWTAAEVRRDVGVSASLNAETVGTTPHLRQTSPPALHCHVLQNLRSHTIASRVPRSPATCNHSLPLMTCKLWLPETELLGMSLVAVLSERYGPENHLMNRNHLFQDPTFSEGDSILQALYGFIFVVDHEGEVFFASRTVEQYLGFHQSDIIHQSVMELIHSEDREEFKRQLLWNSGLPQEKSDMTFHTAMLPENSAYMFRSFTVRFRCLLDNTSGFITLEINGWIRLLHGQNLKTTDDPQVALFATCCPFGPMSLLDLPSRDLTFRSKHKMDLAPVSMDNRGRMLFGYTDRDLTLKTGYDLIHPDDLTYFAAAHEELIKTGSSGLIAYRWQTHDLQWVWLQSSCRVIYKNSKPDFVIATHRQLTNDEGEDLFVKRGSEFKLPYPLLDIDICSGFGFSDDDLATKSKTPKVKKPKAPTVKDFPQTQGSPRRKRCGYKDIPTPNCDPYNLNAYPTADELKNDYVYPYPGTSYTIDPDIYRTYPVFPGTAMYSTPDSYKLDTDRHSAYSNGYYFDHRQYPNLSYHGNGYPDIMSGKYGYDYPKYGLDGYTIDIKKKSRDDDYLAHFDSLRKYGYDYGSNSRVNGTYDTLPLRSCHNYPDNYVSMIENNPVVPVHDVLRDSNRNLLTVDNFSSNLTPPKQYPSYPLQDSITKPPVVNLNYSPPSALTSYCESERDYRNAENTRNLPTIPWNSCIRTSQDAAVTSTNETNETISQQNVQSLTATKGGHFVSSQISTDKNTDRGDNMGSVAISVIQQTEKLHNRSCEDTTKVPSWPAPATEDYIKPWTEDYHLPHKHSSVAMDTYHKHPTVAMDTYHKHSTVAMDTYHKHPAVAMDTYLANNTTPFRLGFNMM